jgi:hypothetical protein
MDHQANNAGESALDALVMLLDLELSTLKMLEYRLGVLRLTLIYGNTEFIHLAATELGDVTMSMSGVEGGRAEALTRAKAALDQPQVQSISALTDVVDEPHRGVLRRLVHDLEVATRSVDALRDAVRTSSEDGQRNVRGLLDITDGPNVDLGGHAGSRTFVGEF